MKISIGSIDAMAKKLVAAGFICRLPRYFERNIVWHHPRLSLVEKGHLLRLRRAGDRNILTFKKKTPSKSKVHKVREEMELGVEDFERMEWIFSQLGFSPAFIYEKYRTVYRKGQTEVMIDETPMGVFIEIEGVAADIDATARRMGYSPADYITGSYLSLYRRAGHSGHMVFPEPKG